MRTMTQAQMEWNIRKGFANFERDQFGNVADDWRLPIWTKDGGWIWDVDSQLYRLELPSSPPPSRNPLGDFNVNTRHLA